MTQVNSRFFRLLMVILTTLALGFPKPMQAQDANLDNLNSQALLLINAQNGQILFERDADQALDVGSLSKLLLVYEVYDAIASGQIQLTDRVAISNEAYNLSQDYNISNAPLRQDFDYTVQELLTLVAVGNANGATLALSQHLEVNEDEMILRLNERLRQWGLKDFRLLNVTGLPEDYDGGSAFEDYQGPTNRLSAEALATISYRLINDFPEYLALTSKLDYQLKADTEDAFPLENQLAVLEGGSQSLEGTKGLAMASHPALGYSQILYLNRDNQHIIAISLASNVEEDQMFYAASQLAEYGLAAFETKTLLVKGKVTQEIPLIDVWGGKSLALETVYGEDLVLSVPRGDASHKLSYQHALLPELARDTDTLNAPIQAGQVVGHVGVYDDQAKLSFISQASGNEIPIVANHDVDDIGTVGRTLQWIGRFFSNIITEVRRFFLNLFNA